MTLNMKRHTLDLSNVSIFITIYMYICILTFLCYYMDCYMVGLLEKHRYQEARLFLLRALKACGDTKDIKILEIEYNRLTNLILRPTPNHFEVINDLLGDGNFSKVFKVSSKSSDRTVYAMKVRCTKTDLITPNDT